MSGGGGDEEEAAFVFFICAVLAAYGLKHLALDNWGCCRARYVSMSLLTAGFLGAVVGASAFLNGSDRV
jgi:hypothetical protein